jgi:hypothetical protein
MDMTYANLKPPSPHVKYISSYFEQSGRRKPKQLYRVEMQVREFGAGPRGRSGMSIAAVRKGYANHFADLVLAG